MTMSQWPSPLLVWQLDLPGNLLPPWASNLCQGDLYFTKEIHILASRHTMLEQAIAWTGCDILLGHEGDKMVPCGILWARQACMSTFIDRENPVIDWYIFSQGILYQIKTHTHTIWVGDGDHNCGLPIATMGSLFATSPTSMAPRP